jgi:hypothetical protein
VCIDQIVELGGAVEKETVQQRRPVEVPDAAGVPGFQRILEQLVVDRRAGSDEHDGVRRRGDEVLSKSVAKDEDGLVQQVTGTGIIALGPEQARELAPPDGARVIQYQECEQCEAVTVKNGTRNRPPWTVEMCTAEKRDLQHRAIR